MFPRGKSWFPGERRLLESLVQPIILAKFGTRDSKNVILKAEGTVRRLWTWSFFTGTAVIFMVAAQSHGQQSEQVLRALVPKIVASWETLDLAKVEPYYATDPDLTYFDLAPLKYDNWAEYRATVPKVLFEPNSSIKLKVNDDLRVHSRGSLAWATFTFGADLTSKQGATSHLDGRWTMVLEKRGKGWIVVHEHVSVPLSGS